MIFFYRNQDHQSQFLNVLWTTDGLEKAHEFPPLLHNTSAIVLFLAQARTLPLALTCIVFNASRKENSISIAIYPATSLFWYVRAAQISSSVMLCEDRK